MNGASSMMNYQYAIRYTLYASRSVRTIAQKNLFMQNKPNFPRFCAKNGYLEEKQSQFKANQTQFKANSNPIKPNLKPASRSDSTPIIDNQSSIDTRS